jgi:hypothetical protein
LGFGTAGVCGKGEPSAAEARRRVRTARGSMLAVW